MRLALFIDIGVAQPPRALSESFETVEGYCRISEYVEVEFPPLDSECISRQLGAIDKYANEVRQEFERLARTIQAQRETLTAHS